MLGRLIRVFILGMLTIMVVGHLGINILLNQPDLKATVQEKIADKFGINLHFSDIDYDLYRGISLDHIQIKGEDAGKYFDLDIDKIRINIALHELLFRRCVIEELDIINSVFFISPTPRTAAKEKQGQVSSEVPLKKGTSQIRKDQSQLKSKGKEIRAKKPWLFTLQNINIAHTVVYIQSQPIALELENIRVIRKINSLTEDSWLIKADILHPIHVPFELKILKKYQSNTYICAMSLGSLKGYWALFYTHHWTIPYCVFKTFGFKIIGAGSLDLRSKYFSIQAGLYGPIKDLYEKLLHINKTAIDPLIFRGIINGYLFAEGPLDNFNAIRGGIRLLGSPLSVDKIQFTELDLRCFLNRSMLIIPLSRVGIGKGHGELFSWFDCKDPFHYGLNLSFEKIQFGHLLSVVLGKPQDIDGIAYGKMTAFGQGKDIRDIKGFANIHIDDISNWNIKLTSRYLSMINYFLPGLSEAVFNRATVSLALYKGWCWIREMKILSPAISMETAGKIGLLQGDLDMLLRIKPSKMSTNPKYFFSKALLLSLKALGGDLVDFSIQGTLSDPSFSRVHLPEDASLTSLFFAPVRMLTPAKKDKN